MADLSQKFNHFWGPKPRQGDKGILGRIRTRRGKRAMGIMGKHHMEAWVMDGTTDYKSSKYNHDPSMIINYESSNYIKYQKL